MVCFFKIAIILSFLTALAALTIDKIEVKSVDTRFLSFDVKEKEGNPKTFDIRLSLRNILMDVTIIMNSLKLVNGTFEQWFPMEQFSICDLLEADDSPLGTFFYNEVLKITKSKVMCPIYSGVYNINGIKIFDEKTPFELTQKNYKLEVKGSYFNNGFELVPLFTIIVHLTDE